MRKFIKKLLFKFIFTIILTAFFGVLSGKLSAQDKTGTISGTVVDKSGGAPIEGADVTIHNNKDSSLVKGTSTDASGKFTLSPIPLGRYYIKVNLVGYNFAVVSGISVTPQNLTVTLDPIKLSSGSTTTEEIVVEGQKSIMEFRPDKKVFNVEQNITAQGGTLLDLLKQVPSVTVDQDGNVSLRGSEGVKILIDGRPQGLEGQSRNIILQNISASDVESIELVTNPSAKFEAEGSAGIINIILKKNRQQGMGYNGTLGLNIATGDKYGGQLAFSLKKDKVNLYGNYNYDLRNFTSGGFSDRFYLTNPDLGEIYQSTTGRGRNKTNFVKLGMDYFMDRMSTLGLSFNYRGSTRGNGNITTNNEYDLSHNLTSNYYTTSNQDNNIYSLDVNSNYMLRFKNPKQVLSAELTYSRDKDNEDEENYDTYISPANLTPNKRNETSDEIKDAFSGKLDYAHPFSKDIMLETGYKLNYTRRDNNYSVETFDYNQNQFIEDPTQSNRFIYSEQVQGLYGIYTQQLGNFGFSLGARVEYTHSNGELAETNQGFTKNYIDIFPSASVSQKITNSTEIQLSYARRINRPRMRQLNPFRSLNGSNSYSQGNPNLNPEFTDALEFNFIQFFPWATITPGVFYRYTKDEISRERSLLDSVSTLTTFVNLNSSKTYGGELIVSSQPARFLNVNGTLSYYRTDVDASNLSEGGSNSTNTWSARGMGTILLPADFSIQMSYFYSGKRVTSNGIMEPFQAFDAAVKKDLFDKKLSLTLRASDIFNTSKFAMTTDDVDFHEYSERTRDSRGLFFNITYKFGQQDKKQQGKKRKEDNNNNEGDEDFGY